MNLPLPSLPFLLSLVYPSPLAARAFAYRGLNKRWDYEPEHRDPKRVQQCMAKASNAAIRCPAHAFVHRRRPQAPPHARTDRAGTDSRPSPSSLVDPCCGPVLVHQDHALQQQQSREKRATWRRALSRRLPRKTVPRGCMAALNGPTTVDDRAPTLFVSLDLPVYYREANSVTYSSTCLYTIGGERVWSHSFAPYIYTGVTTTLTLFDSLYIYREQKSVPTLFGPL